MLPLVYRRAWLAGAGLLGLAIIVGSLLPGPVVAVVSTWDKLEHALAYGALTLWLAGILERGRYPWAAAAAFALGGAVELAQGTLTATRVAEPQDLLANGLGIGLALALAYGGLGGWAGRVEAWLGTTPPGGDRGRG